MAHVYIDSPIIYVFVLISSSPPPEDPVNYDDDGSFHRIDINIG